MTTPQPQVLIVGAGPTGLVLALQLARRGVPFRLIEQNSGPGQASRAMAVQARTLEFYQQLGWADEVVGQGVRIEQLHVHEGGREVAHVALGDAGRGLSPYPFVLVFAQDLHERFLVDKLKAAGIEVEWNTALASFTQDANGVLATLEHEGRREQSEYAYICGCDGAHSRVRESLELPFEGGTYQHLYYVADVELADRANRDLHMHLAARSFLLMLPVRAGGAQRLIGIMPDAAEGQAAPSFDTVRPEAEAMLGIRIGALNWFSTYSAHHRVASAFRKGRGFIAGDAGHVHSPVGAQGMNTGIGDAVNLGWKLAHVLQGRAAPALLDTYEDERIAFARALVATTDRAFQAIVAQGLGGQLLRRWLAPHVLPLLAEHASMRRAAFKAVSQIQIEYEHSALSIGRAGQVQGGDRLPWVADGAQDNFAPSCSADWQVHVYGTASAELSAAAQQAGMPLHLFAWSDAAKDAGLWRDAGYLLRPDGYIAAVMPTQDCAVLEQLVRKFSLRLGAG